MNLNSWFVENVYIRVVTAKGSSECRMFLLFCILFENMLKPNILLAYDLIEIAQGAVKAVLLLLTTGLFVLHSINAVCSVIYGCRFFAVIVISPEETFDTSYQAVMQKKHDALVQTDEPKIILLGGSSLGFGLDEELLEYATGYKVVNLGLHAGFGNLFVTELSKANINPGDIVLCGYEYDWHIESSFDFLGIDLIMSGIDNRIDMYQFFPAEKFTDVLGYLFTQF